MASSTTPSSSSAATATIQRPRSMIVKCSGCETRKALDVIWEHLGKPARPFDCVQVLNKSVIVITAAKLETVTVLLAKGSFVVGNGVAEVTRADSNVTTIRVTGLPYEASVGFIAAHYSRYGRVVSVSLDAHREKTWLQGTPNGVFLVKIDIKKEVPNVIWCGRWTAYNWYSGVQQTCRECGEKGHTAAECRVLVCRNCKMSGHPESSCSAPCGACGATDHRRVRCTAASWASVCAGKGTTIMPIEDEEVQGAANPSGSPEARSEASPPPMPEPEGTVDSAPEMPQAPTEQTAEQPAEKPADPRVLRGRPIGPGGSQQPITERSAAKQQPVPPTKVREVSLPEPSPTKRGRKKGKKSPKKSLPVSEKSGEQLKAKDFRKESQAEVIARVVKNASLGIAKKRPQILSESSSSDSEGLQIDIQEKIKIAMELPLPENNSSDGEGENLKKP